MKLRWNTLGGKLGLFFCLAGLAVMWAGWNGAASYNDIRKQFPYLISGGIAGLALVVIGVGLLIIQSQRADRVQLEANLDRAAPHPRADDRPAPPVERRSRSRAPDPWSSPAPAPTTAPTCKLVAGRDLRKMTRASRPQSAGLEPCRTCAPEGGAEVDLASPDPASGTRGR